MNAVKAIFGVVAVIATLVIVGMNVGINDAGYRTTIQFPNGSMRVQFEPGYYMQWFGKTTEYPDYLTYDFSADDGRCEFAQGDGVKVRYQDGGEGAVCGMVRVGLPDSEKEMLDLHKTFRDNNGIRSKLLNQAIPKSLNLTASLMTSEEAYATKRSEFIQIGRDQTVRGIYQTRLVKKEFEVGVDEKGNPEIQERDVPEIVIGADGRAKTNGSDFEAYGIYIQDFTLKSWDFEKRTLDQISEKRKAEMAIVTAKAERNKAFYEKERVEAEGKKNVAQAEYAELEKAKREIVQQEKEAEKAVIAARQNVDVAAQRVEEQKQVVLAKEQEKLAAQEEAERIRTLADAEAHAKRVVLEADNALAQKIEAIVAMNAANAEAQAKRPVPATVIYSGTKDGQLGGSDDVSNILATQLLKNVKALDLDLNVKKNK